MAAPTYATDLTDIFTDGTTTGWTALGGGQAGLNQETDYFIQGTSCLSKNAWSDALKGMIFNAGAKTITAGDAVFVWITHATSGSLDSQTNGGLRVLIGSGTGDFYSYYVAGNDTIVYDDRWLCIPIDPRTGTITPDLTTGTPSATKSYFGGEAKMVGGPTKGSPFAVDAMRFGRAFIVTNGDLANGYATFAGAASYQDDTISRRWGLFQFSGGVYKQQGLFQMGSAGTAVDFRDSDRVIFVANTEYVTAGFNEFEVVNASSHVEWTNISVQALGTVAPGVFTVTDNATVILTTCTFTLMSTFAFLSNTTVDTCTFNGCGQITHGGATMNGSIVKNYEGTANTSALLYNVAADPDGEMDGMSFVKGTAATHAIEFGTTSPLTMTLRNIDFSGYNAANSQNDSTLHIKRTSGTVTINIIGGSGNVSYRSDGATVNIVLNPVTVTITVKDVDTGSIIAGARVFLEASDGTGPYPYQESVTITRSGSTATVAHTAHGMATGDWVHISGAVQNEYNGAHQITVTGANAYTFTVSGTPATPATGTITSTWALLNATTDGSGQVSDTRAYTSNQPLSGRVRKSTASPYYKNASVVGTVDSASGLSLTVQMVSDE